MTDPVSLRSAVERLIQQWREKSKSLRDAGLDLAGKRGAAQKKCYELAGASEALDLCADQSEAALAVVRAPQSPSDPGVTPLDLGVEMTPPDHTDATPLDRLRKSLAQWDRHHHESDAMAAYRGMELAEAARALLASPATQTPLDIQEPLKILRDVMRKDAGRLGASAAQGALRCYADEVDRLLALLPDPAFAADATWDCETCGRRRTLALRAFDRVRELAAPSSAGVTPPRDQTEPCCDGGCASVTYDTEDDGRIIADVHIHGYGATREAALATVRHIAEKSVFDVLTPPQCSTCGSTDPAGVTPRVLEIIAQMRRCVSYAEGSLERGAWVNACCTYAEILEKAVRASLPSRPAEPTKE